MPKRSDQRDAAKAEYIARRKKGESVNLKTFAQEIGMPYSTVRRWKGEDAWEKAVPRKRGGPVGNTNAEKDGAYRRIFFDKLTEEELAFVAQTPLESKAAMQHEMQVLKLQEKKILDAIAKYENEPEDALHTTSVLDMREPGGRGPEKIDGKNQTMGMYTKDSPFARIMKLRDALNKVQGRIAAISNAMRQAEEFAQRVELENKKLELMRMRAIGVMGDADVGEEMSDEARELTELAHE
jgi:DNA-binding transcriptional regulator YiaG